MTDVYRAYPIGRRVYWRTASVVMACHQYDAAAPNTDEHWFEASWQRKWWGGKVLTLTECFPARDNGRASVST